MKRHHHYYRCLALLMLISISVQTAGASSFNLKSWSTLSQKGESALKRGMPDVAQKYFAMAIRVVDNPESPLYPVSIRNLADAYRQGHMIKQAREMYQQDLSLSERLSFPLRTTHSLYYLATMDISEGLYTQAEQKLERALNTSELSLGGQGQPDKIDILTALARVYLHQHQGHEFAQTVALLKSLLNALPLRHCAYRSIAAVDYFIEDNDWTPDSPEAKQLERLRLDLSQQVVERTKVEQNKILHCSGLINLGRVCRPGDPGKALQLAEEAFEILKANSCEGAERATLCSKLGDLFGDVEQYTKAANQYKQAISIRESLRNSFKVDLLQLHCKYMEALEKSDQKRTLLEADRSARALINELNPRSSSELRSLTDKFRSGLANENLRVYLYSKLGSGNATSGDVLLERADTYSRLNKFELAIADYSALLAKTHNAKVYLARGNAYLMLNDFAHAQADYDQAERLEPKMAEPVTAHGHLYARMRNYPAAKEAFTRSISLGEEGCHLHLANLYLSKGDSNNAAIEYKWCIQHKIETEKCLCALAGIYVDTKRFADAIPLYDKAIAMSPYNFCIYLSRGDTYAELGDLRKAFADYDRAVHIAPKDPHTYRCRGYRFEKAGNFERAIEEFRTAIQVAPTDIQSLIDRGVALATIGKLAEALTDFNTALKIDPKNADLYVLRADHYGRMKDFDAAIKDYTRAMKMKANYGPAYWGIGCAYTYKGNYKLALECFNRAAAIAPKESFVYIHRASLYSLMHDYVKALKDCETAVKLHEPDFGIHLNYGDILQESGNCSKAITEYTRAIELNPNHIKPYLGRAACFSREHHFQEAINDYSKALSLDPSYEKAKERLGELKKLQK